MESRYVLHLSMENITLFTCRSIHQGNERFSGESRGKQCAFMCLSALLCDHIQLVLPVVMSRNGAANASTQYFRKVIRRRETPL